MVDAYLDILRIERHASPLTIREYGYDLSNFCAWLSSVYRRPVRRQDILALTRPQIRRWLKFLDDKQLASTTRARKYAAVNGFYKHLVQEGFIPQNPCEGLRPPASNQRNSRLVVYLTREEVDHLLQTIPSTRGLSRREYSYHEKLWRRDYALIVTLLYQGLRIGEAAGLTLGSFDFSEAILRVVGKGNKERLIPLHERTLAAMNEYLDTWEGPVHPEQPRDPIWQTLRGTALTRDAARKAVQRQLNRAFLLKATPHKLRHTFGTRLANGGVDLLVIRDLMGHASLETTKQYTHVASQRLRAAMEALD